MILYKQSSIYELSLEFKENFDFVEYNIVRLNNYFNKMKNVSYYNSLLRTSKLVKLFDIPSKNYL